MRGTPEQLFDVTQDYGMRKAWDPFPESYRFEGGAQSPGNGVRLTVHARNGFRMTVEYVSYSRPHVAAITMIRGPWFIAKFAGSWQFSPRESGHTLVTFKYNVLAAPALLRALIQPILNRSFAAHAHRRLTALKQFVEQPNDIGKKS